MHNGSLPRARFLAVEPDLAAFPAVTLLGPRHCGKTTPARAPPEATRARGGKGGTPDSGGPGDRAGERGPSTLARAEERHRRKRREISLDGEKSRAGEAAFVHIE